MRYMMDTEGTTEPEARLATERYMAMPGQALAYKIGALKIQALRQRARDAMGSRFSIPGFHDRVLAQGTLPLTVLEREVDAWITRNDGPLPSSSAPLGGRAGHSPDLGAVSSPTGGAA
jgi:uncharacterized protein (DUF885 family)